MRNQKSSMAARRHELLADMVDQAERLLINQGIMREIASVIANAMADHFARHWGGQLINFPMDYRWRHGHRDLAIYDAHQAGASYAELAAEHKLHERYVRTIVERMTRMQTEQRRRGHPGQQSFFPDPS